MISSSSSIIKVIKSISELDRSIFDDPIKFEGYVKDFYSGNSVVVDDFITILRNLNDSIISHAVNSGIINSSCNCLKNSECVNVQVALFNIIYVIKKIQTIEKLESEIRKAYKLFSTLEEESKFKAKAKKIKEFNANVGGEVQYGKIIHLSWICNNPFQLILSNNNENMDVTSITSIDLSVTSDIYELLLYDSSGRIIDKAMIKIPYRDQSFCMFCGTPIYDVSDKYCINCGLKL